MAKYVVEDTTLTGIADAIRAKTGSADPIPVSDMAAQIGEITGGGGGGSAEGIVYVTYRSGDVELCKTACMAGDSTVDPVEDGKIATPTKDPTESTVYTYAGGWSMTDGGEADATALMDVTEDRVVYAVYNESVREYIVNFYDGETLLESLTVAYGTVPRPTAPEKYGYYFEGWSPELVAVTGDADYYATWSTAMTFANASWEEIAAISESGEAANTFAIGETKTIEYAGGTVEVKIAAFNHDDLADGSGKAGMTIICTAQTVDKYPYSTAFSFVAADMSAEIKNNLPSDLASALKTVTKTIPASMFNSNATTTCDIEAYLPTITELGAVGCTNRSHSFSLGTGSKICAAAEGTAFELYADEMPADYITGAYHQTRSYYPGQSCPAFASLTSKGFYLHFSYNQDLTAHYYSFCFCI